MKRITPDSKFLDWKTFDETNPNLWVCGIYFEPEEEDDYFPGCPPYMAVMNTDTDEQTYFRLPHAIAYYAKTHVGYTRAGIERRKEEGRKGIQTEIKNILGI